MPNVSEDFFDKNYWEIFFVNLDLERRLIILSKIDQNQILNFVKNSRI